jgi:hypothetical protein
MFGVLTHVFTVMPAAFALGVLRSINRNAKAF